ncbi:uncharacterized protein KQ657_005192 [Scheffersomyces spartinae]|uniref:DUF155 domain-containing protein n=1 Tax=Scheffersomyces spartinae TaxID=45513 RepID=A0A9P8AI36_9ASCO|nr:uncharacterized protein KQ657_005192 [Scheffersomyces spartinae]KAG7193993.1 hypothetical protein KQ657_005192 [Scheffersomyces spartinae]
MVTFVERLVSNTVLKPKKKLLPIAQNLRRTTKPGGETGLKGDAFVNAEQMPEITIEGKKVPLNEVVCLTLGEQLDIDTIRQLVLKEAGVDSSDAAADHLQSDIVSIVGDECLLIPRIGYELMVLLNGSVVGWGHPKVSEKQILEDPLVEHLKRGTGFELSEPYETIESDELDYVELNEVPKLSSSSSSSYLQGEVFVVQGIDTTQRNLDKAAFAMGFSRSTRLAILENALDKHLQSTRANSERMSRGMKIDTNEGELLRLTGRLFLLRGKLNLYSELIEVPDLYWTEPTLEVIYEDVSKILDISTRISILNRKLDYATDEQRAFLGVLNEKKGTRLEWIIIILITVEVGFEILRMVKPETQNHDILEAKLKEAL